MPVDSLQMKGMKGMKKMLTCELLSALYIITIITYFNSSNNFFLNWQFHDVIGFPVYSPVNKGNTLS